MANTNSMKQIALTCSGHTRPVTHLDFSDITESGNSFLISACKDGKPMLRLGDTGDWVGTFEGHKGAVFGVGLNRKATLAASGAADFSAKLWDAISGEEKCNYQHNHTVKSVAFDEDSTHLLTGNNEKLIRVFDLNQPSTNPAVEIYAGHSGAIKRALFCRNDKCIISCAEDKAIRIWDRSSGQEIHHIDFPCNPSNIEISRDGSILTIANGMNVTFYEANSWNKIKEVAVPSKLADASLHPDKLAGILGLSDLKLGILGLNDSRLNIMVLNDPKLNIFALNDSRLGILGLNDHKLGVLGLSDPWLGIFGLNDPRLNIMVLNDPRLNIMVLNDPRLKIMVYNDSKLGILGLNDQKLCILGLSDTRVGILGLNDPRLNIMVYNDSRLGILGLNDLKLGVLGLSDLKLGILGFNDPKLNIMVLNDSRLGILGLSDSMLGILGLNDQKLCILGLSDPMFVCGGEDFKIYKFDYMTGNEIQSFKGHFGPVHCISFSPDGELYASGSEDGTLRLWQTTVGKTYGLWKCINGPEGEVTMNNSAPREVTAN
ncbi:unnamed protein product [Chironomus riparius]|uniref:Serine-threonine kinase receptor-associated protein n=1 Tax=Chironomus riparius TaxID=315576 RepID=A0A9N9S656_9DIPT|nr:unnamed protein product [Chironomus riparius]